MRKSLFAASLMSAVVAAPAIAADSPHSFTGNFTVASEYLYRGIAQSNNKPAVQGGFDYSHAPSGLYFGNWNSSISWIADAGLGASSSIEMDFYGGIKFNAGPVALDLGGLYYFYPGTYPATWDAVYDSPNTFELYAAATWKWLTLKYSHSTTTLFGNKNSSGSGYLELNGSWDLGSGWGLTAHVGRQRVAGISVANYTDYKIGATKDVGFGVIGVAFSDTNAKKSFYVNTVNSDMGKERVVVTFGKTF